MLTLKDYAAAEHCVSQVGGSPSGQTIVGAVRVWDLALFGVWYDAQLGLLRALDAVRAAGIDIAEFARTANTQLGHVGTATSATVEEMRQATYPPGPADLTEHLTWRSRRASKPSSRMAAEA